VLSLKNTIASLARNRGRWEALMRAGPHSRAAEAVPSRLEEVRSFGTNPGNLRMFTYRPARRAAEPALVVVLHGCTQSAAGYDLGAGWSTLADRYGFALLLPEQQPANNPKRCFNWFVPNDTRRDRGEALSIRQMIEAMVVENGIDRARVFITGLSAGGAMTSVMLACYPEVFAGGAIIAGLPYGAAANVQEAFESMFQSPARPARQWGDLVRAASPHAGAWPRISVWHGDADTTVIPRNAQEILKQWADVHGLPAAPSREAMVDGYPRKVWLGPAGEELIESYTITHMAHGTPLATATADEACGAAGPFLLDVGISSSYHIAKFFGLTARAGAARPMQHARVTIVPEQRPDAEPAPARPEAEVLYGEVLDPEPEGKPQHGPASPHAPIDIGAVIARALTAAGLMKSRS
jgi:poly(hydroxyalkanoate) depolymerase family esterase